MVPPSPHFPGAQRQKAVKVTVGFPSLPWLLYDSGGAPPPSEL